MLKPKAPFLKLGCLSHNTCKQFLAYSENIQIPLSDIYCEYFLPIYNL